MKIKVHVSRFDKEKDEKPYIETYEIEKTPEMKVLEALNLINEQYNANIAFRSSCRAGQCGSCAVRVKGNAALACKKEIVDGATIEPLKLPIIKDLIVDRSSIENKVENMDFHLETKDPEGLYTPQQIEDTIKVRSCIECYSCLTTCPVYQKFQEDFAGPYFMRYISKFEFDPREMKDRLREGFENGLYDCTSCGKCGDICPKNINSFGDAVEKLRAIAYSEGKGPLEAHKKIRKMVKETGRSVSKPEKGGFIEAINKIKKDTGKEKPKVALFTGCMVDYRLQHVGEAVMKVFEANGIDVDVPEGQVCCGSPLLRTGQRDAVQELADKNKEVFKDYDTVVTICAGCGATLKNDHPKFGNTLNVLDISEFLIDKLDTSKMKPVDMKVTWHDPCHLARGQRIKDQPRDIIDMIPGVKFEEMEFPCQCCGAGGGVKSAKPEIAMELSKDKARMIKETGADTFITICPFCQSNLLDGLEEIGETQIKGMNLVELLKLSYCGE
ncbi:MAG: succinate dehydrogenase/fumarate reductase iron-sulfur subunit [Methanobacteriaceae archaeon]|nr:succinate dehydrogenase/fumarate reductase iron-sulfur subunit [Methanobacteriaceae archaeon]